VRSPWATQKISTGIEVSIRVTDEEPPAAVGPGFSSSKSGIAS